MVITCGDGTQFRPDWLNANKTVEYNVAEFEFKELAGTLVYRGLPRGARYGIELFFQGADHLDSAAAFEAAAADPRAWTMYHPYYGTITVQPIGLTFDNSAENISRITGVIVETISTGELRTTVSAADKIANDKAAADAALAASYVKDVPSPVAADRISIADHIDNIYEDVSEFIQSNTDISDFTNAYNEANTTLNKASFNTLQLVQQVQALINLPATFADTLAKRLNMLALQLSFLNSGVASIARVADKKLYENNAGTVIGAMVLASVTSPGDAYANRTGVLSVIDTIYDAYNEYLEQLDSLQSINGGSPDSYIPNGPAISALGKLVSYAVTALLDVAADAKQERRLALEEDSNCILLANRFYGLKDDDSTIDYFRETNNIKITENLIIRKGREIVYYV